MIASSRKAGGDVADATAARSSVTLAGQDPKSTERLTASTTGERPATGARSSAYSSTLPPPENSSVVPEAAPAQVDPPSLDSRTATGSEPGAIVTAGVAAT